MWDLSGEVGAIREVAATEKFVNDGVLLERKKGGGRCPGVALL